MNDVDLMTVMDLSDIDGDPLWTLPHEPGESLEELPPPLGDRIKKAMKSKRARERKKAAKVASQEGARAEAA
jgi:hypothetical protein